MPQGGKAMSQDNTYRPAVLPSEAVMMPAVEETEIPDTPHPAELSEADVEGAAKVPARARTRGTGAALERIRGRMRDINVQNYEWVDATERPLDGAARQTSAQPANPHNERQESRMMAQGTALSTLMRTATRQHSPTPELTPPMRVQKPSVQTTGQPQRDALRKVVQGAQQQPKPGNPQ